MSSLQELMNYTLVSKYSRWLKEKKRRETWKEMVDRVRGMMLQRYEGKGIDEEINWAYDMMYKKKVLGSQRALQFGGIPALKKNSRIFNCVSSYCDRPKFFQECFWLLLCGCGTGFSVQKHHVARLPKLKSVEDMVGRPTKKYVIPDTIEGWSDALGVLLSSYFATDPIFPEYANCNVEFDFSLIRPKGSPLSHVGKAPGPEGLKLALERIDLLLSMCVLAKRERLRPIDCYDIVMHASDAVLSGGVRRSATICVFSLDDEEMLQAKTGDWLKTNPQRARSNNSAILLRNHTTQEEFLNVIKHVKEYGEPGFIWADDLEFLINPCAEIGFWCYYIRDQKKYDKFMKTYDGQGYQCDPKDIGLESGWQGCNLSTVNASTVVDLQDFEERGRAASIIGTCQAGFTEFKYLEDVSSLIFEREALLGVSMTGVMEKFEIVLDPSYQKKVANIIKKTNAKIAKKIGINLAARTTCLKPEGTSSCVLGTSSGIHPHHSTRYLRRSQVNRMENVYKHFKNINPEACERSVWSANDTDDNIMFPIEVPDGAKTKNQLPALELLKIVKSVQQNWVMTGKRTELCTQPWLSHNVSNTITVLPDEWDEVAKFIYKNRAYFCGISLLSDSADKDYPQAPFVAVYTPKEIAREYGDAALWTSGLIDRALETFDGDLWAACDVALNNKNKGYPLKFNTKARKFADRYFDGDLKRLTYCMKDVYNWKVYYDLQKSFKPVDYTTLIEEEDETKPEAEIACANGMCLIS